MLVNHTRFWRTALESEWRTRPLHPPPKGGGSNTGTTTRRFDLINCKAPRREDKKGANVTNTVLVLGTVLQFGVMLPDLTRHNHDPNYKKMEGDNVSGRKGPTT